MAKQKNKKIKLASNIEKIKTLRNPKAKKNRNISKRIPNGLILQTRDEFFEGQGNYKKPGYQNTKTFYRKAIVVDSNKKDELAVIKGTTKPGDNIQGTKTNVRYYVEILDDENNPIKLGKKFISSKEKISEKCANSIKHNAINNIANKSLRKRNRKKLRQLKGR